MKKHSVIGERLHPATFGGPSGFRASIAFHEHSHIDANGSMRS
jgi:hypothetical protein